jgi:hypothetical protein
VMFIHIKLENGQRVALNERYVDVITESVDGKAVLHTTDNSKGARR